MKIKEGPVCLDCDKKIIRLGDKCIHTTSWGKSKLHKAIIVSIISDAFVRVMPGFEYDHKLYDKSKDVQFTYLVKGEKLFVLD